MAGAFDDVRGAAQTIEQKHQAGGFDDGDILYFKISDGDSAVVRFLEPDPSENDGKVYWCWAHELPPRGKQKWGDNVACLDQKDDGTPCPGCEAGLGKSFLGFVSMIWRDAPVYGTKGDGKTDWSKVVGKEDRIAVWERGIQTFEELDGKDATYKGLTSRDFRITRRGSSTDTKYSIDPADPDGGPKPMSEADAKLKGTKPDMKQLITPPSYETVKRWIVSAQGGGGSAAANGATTTAQPAATGGEVNPFL